MIDNEKDIRDDDFRVITHSDFHKKSSRTFLGKNWWIVLALAVVAAIVAGLLLL